MPGSRIALLGAVAGFTIYLGLPIGRLRATVPRARALLNALAAGILLFLLWDVLTHAWEPVDTAVTAHRYGTGLREGLVLAGGLTIGLLGLVSFDQQIARRRAAGDPERAPGDSLPTEAPGPAPDAQHAGVPGRALPGQGDAPVTATVTVAPPVPALGGSGRAAARQLALMIAIGIGLHNFAEGLAIGNSAAQGQLALALLLVIGFGLHNATEGFGIVAPLAAAGIRPTWSQLGVLGLIGGGPTFLGTLIGQWFSNDLVSIAFLALAAGSILYVVVELLAIGRRIATKPITTWGLLAGLLLGFATDAIVTAAGA